MSRPAYGHHPPVSYPCHAPKERNVDGGRVNDTPEKFPIEEIGNTQITLICFRRSSGEDDRGSARMHKGTLVELMASFLSTASIALEILCNEFLQLCTATLQSDYSVFYWDANRAVYPKYLSNKSVFYWNAAHAVYSKYLSNTVFWLSSLHERLTTRTYLSNPDSRCVEPGVIKAVEAKKSATWVVATAAPHHATEDRALLSGFVTEHDDLFVHAVDGSPMQVLARGAVVTDAVVLPNVSFIPGLTMNLVSVRQLVELAYSVEFSRRACYIRRAADGTVVGKAHDEGGLYVLDFLKVSLAI